MNVQKLTHEVRMLQWIYSCLLHFFRDGQMMIGTDCRFKFSLTYLAILSVDSSSSLPAFVTVLTSSSTGLTTWALNSLLNCAIKIYPLSNKLYVLIILPVY